jgi:2-epi-5-epi-valiolone 7-phosphate 2-epimerase
MAIGVAQWCLDADPVRAIHRAAGSGLRVIHLNIGRLSDPTCLTNLAVRSACLKAARQTGVRITALAANALNDHGLTSPPGSAEHAACQTLIRTAIEAAVALEAGVVIVPSFRNSEIRTTEDLARTAAQLRVACDEAAPRQVLIASETPLGVAGNRALLEQVAHPALRILVDAYNPVLRGHPVSDIVRELSPFICDQVHAKDGLNDAMGSAPLNTGDARFGETVRALRDVGFRGDIVLENKYLQRANDWLLRDMQTVTALLDV